jgi:hypothetical protein
MKEIILTALYVAMPISVMSMAAFLIYCQSPGWGWFLAVAAVYVLSVKWSIK